jgi:hypothetical protein
MSSFPSSTLTVVAVGVMMRLMAQAATKTPPTNEAGHPVLPRFYGIMGAFACAAGLGLAGYFLLWHYSPDDLIALLLILVMAFGLDLPLLLMAYVARLTLTPEGLHRTTALGRQRFVRWADIESVRYGAVSMEVTVSDGRQKIKCHAHAVGFPRLVEALSQHLGRSRAELGIPEL